MKILGLIASPRKLGNSEILVKEMLATLPETYEKEILRLTDLQVNQCKACYACLPQEKKCILHDDLAFFLDRIRNADAIIIGAPCYFLGAHTSLKLIGDRLISIVANSEEFAGKKCVIAVSYGVPGWSGYAREAALNFARFLNLDVVGIMTVKAANPGEVAVPDILEKARELARGLLSQKPPLQDENLLHCNDCDSTLLQVTTAGLVVCPMCGAKGALETKDAKTSIQFLKSSHSRFSPEGFAVHATLLDNIKGEFLKKRTELAKQREIYKQYDRWWIKP